MLEKELHLERDLFLFLNGSDSAYWDNFFYIYSGISTWIVFYLCFIAVFIYKRQWKEIVCTIVAVTLVITLCDQLSSSVCKPLFHRFRPTHHPDFEMLVDTVKGLKGGLYGFFSGHAANSFGFATFTALLFRNRLFTATILTFAILNAYSRIYLGLHFISDIVAGMAVGVLMGYLGYFLFNFARQKWLKIPVSELKRAVYPKQAVYFLTGVYGLHLLAFFLFENQLIKLF
ncbi:MAG: phosphatase PAP2 family protein [Dysgonamonadaceae bacterium]|jgi:undecaprenyl-diphosphatase|nr:phosphatase PAP2 family protein [Dysgonamonadaceae bacterium]